jgi:CRP/FNR family transcriptional regulator, cyclic AMP receptor protein
VTSTDLDCRGKGVVIKDEVGSYVVRDKNRPERRRHPRKRAFWLGRLETPDGRFDCRVLNLSPSGAKVMLAHAVQVKQAVTLIIEPLGEFLGIVGWRRDSYIGIEITEHRAGSQDAATSAPASGELPTLEGAAPGTAAETADISVVRQPTLDPLDLLHDARSIRTLQPGEVLFKEGDSAQSLYIVKSGALRIKSGNVVYEDVQTGGIVGEMGLVEQHMPRSATVYALTAAEVVEIDERRFFSLVERIPSFAIAVMRVLSRRLRHMDDLYRPERWTGLHR